MQIDAAINPGNSGGPAFADVHGGTVVGVAFSKNSRAEGVGYIIPYIVVEHFLESYKRHGMFQGLCCLGVLVQRLENPSLRRFHQVLSGRLSYPHSEWLCLPRVSLQKGHEVPVCFAKLRGSLAHC